MKKWVSGWVNEWKSMSELGDPAEMEACQPALCYRQPSWKERENYILPGGAQGCWLVHPRTRAPNSTQDAASTKYQNFMFYARFFREVLHVSPLPIKWLFWGKGKKAFNIWKKITEAAEKMNTCLLSKQNGFSKFPPEKSALSRLGPGSYFPSFLPTPTSTFYFFVFLRRISTGQEESHSPPPRVPKPLHAVGRRGGIHPWPIPTYRPEEWGHVWGPWVAHRDQTKFGVSAICVKTPTPASWGTHRHMGWDETPDRDRPMATGWQGTHCSVSAAALSYSRLLSIANLKWLIFTACSYKFLKTSGPKLGQVFPRGFFCSFALPSRIYLPLPAKQRGLCSRGKRGWLSRASLLFNSQHSPPCVRHYPVLWQRNGPGYTCPRLHPGGSQGSKNGDHPLGPQDAHHLSVQRHPLWALPRLPAGPPPLPSGGPVRPCASSFQCYFNFSS